MRSEILRGGGRFLEWSGEAPVMCECCGAAITAVFVDCKTIHGVWGSFCVGCAGELAVSAAPPLCRVFQASSSGWVSFF